MRKLLIGASFTVFSICSFGQAKINYALKKELDSIFAEDQKLRNLVSSPLLQTKADSIAESFKIPKTELVNHIVKMIPIIDSSNFNRIEQIIKQYGYPGKSLVGTGTNEAAFFVLQHSENIGKYLPIIKEAADKNELSFQLYAMMLDRSLMYKGKEQIYGTQGKGFESVNPETGKKEFKRIIWPIKDVSEVNKMRQKAGFTTTIEEYAKQLGIPYKVYTLEEVSQLQKTGTAK